MSTHDASHVRDLLAQANELPGDQRSAFLDRACADDSVLRGEVEALLGALDEGAKFLFSPVADRPAPTTGLFDPDLTRADSSNASPGPGTSINHYKLTALIGEGGFGRVYLAEQEQPVRRQVALKIIKPGMDTRAVIARFKAECQVLALMDHPNIARVLDAGSTEAARPYFVMELVRGVPITEYCDTVRLSLDERLGLFATVCNAIQHAHLKGIIHRDIKPGNVLVTMSDGHPIPKVIDFGVAKAVNFQLTDATALTEARQWLGTPQYMSPEQAGGGPGDVDTRSDIYSLGVLLYELLTGATPFDSRQLRQAPLPELQRIIREVEPPRPSLCLTGRSGGLDQIAARRQTDARKLPQLIRGELDWIVMRCLEKDRTRRYETAGALARDVAHYLEGEPISAGPPSRSYRMRKFVRRNRVLFVAASLVVAALLLGTIGTTIGLLRARKAAAIALEQRDAAARSASNERRAAARAAAVNSFLLKMLGAADPRLTKGKDVLVRDLLDQAAQEVADNPPADLDTADSIQHTLGAAYQSLGLYARAADHFGKSLDLRIKRYGPSALEVARCMGERADSLWDNLQYAAAEPLYRKSLQLRTQLLGPDNAEVAMAMQRVANMLQGKGDYTGANDYYLKALDIRRRLLGEDNLETAQNLVGLALLRRDAGQREQAKTLTDEALRIQRKLLGDKDPRVAETLVVLGSVSGTGAPAELAYAQALDIQKQTLGADHPRIAVTLVYLARKMEDRGEFGDEPEALLLDALRINRKFFGDSHGEVARNLERLGELYAGRKAWPQAQGTLQQSLAMLRATLGEDAPEVGWVVRDLVSVYIAQDEFADAESMLLLRYQWSTRQNESRFSQEVIHHLIDTYRAWNKPAETAKWSSLLPNATTRSS